MTESFEYISGFGGRYIIGDQGSIFDLVDGSRREVPTRLIGGTTLVVRLYLPTGERVSRTVGRLVASHFLDGFNPNLQVKHINKDTLDNRIENLEQIELEGYDQRTLRPWPTGKRVRIVEMGKVFPSVELAAREVNGKRSKIYDVLAGRRNTHRGYHFVYESYPRIVYNNRRFD